MKILVNGINHTPELTGIGKYTGEMVRWLTEQGHDVRVITAPPYYPQWKVQEGYSAFLYHIETIDNAKVYRCPLWVPAKPSALKRIIHLASFAITALPLMIWNGLFWRPDIVFVVEPPIACVPGALIAGWLANATKWLHIQDFEVDAAFDLDILKSKKLRSLISGIEKFLMRRFEMVSTISLKMREKLHEKGVDNAKTFLFENWVEVEKIYPIAERSPLMSELNIPKDRLVILYSGNMGEKQGLEVIVRAAEKLNHRDDLLFLMCGDGSSKIKLELMSKDLNNIKFIPLQPLDKLNDLLNLAYVHLLPQQAGVEDLVMPSKLTNMMASGKPVIATVKPQSQVARVLKLSGLIVPPGDFVALCTAIEKLAAEPEYALEMGKAGRQYVEEHWDIDKVLSSVFKRFNKV